MSAYKTLEKIFERLDDIEKIKAVLHWDSAVVMPKNGVEARGEQLATLDRLYNAILVDDGVSDLIENAKSEKLDPWCKTNLVKMEKIYKHKAVVPGNLEAELIKLTAKSEQVWRKARQDNDFKLFAPYLKKIIKLVREIANIKAREFGLNPYDVLLDQYDEGRKSVQVDKIFENLKEFLPGFIDKVREKQQKEQIIPIEAKFDVKMQEELGRDFLSSLGFDFNSGRLDVSTHPFCGGYKSDIRITTRYSEDSFITGLMGILHEGGHAMYEAHLPARWQRQPVGRAAGMTIHESQSLLIEMQVCRSEHFLKYAVPKIKKAFNIKAKAFSIENLRNVYQKVEPSLIRVDADEVTYPAHIMVRYYIEKYLINDEMEVEDIPDAWSQGIKKFLGIKPKTDSEGCLQDVHWSEGIFGYFPTYALGAMASAQFFAKAKEDEAGIITSIEKGDFKPLVAWLGKNIHAHASRYNSDELLQKVTGSSLDVEVYKNYLQDRYL